MDKLTAIKIKYDDGTYSDEIPVSALAENVEWDDTHTLMNVLGSVDVDITGTIQDQIDQLFNEKIGASELNNYVASQLNTDVTKWLNKNVNPVGSAVVVDKSLSIEGAAADGKATGDALDALKEDLNYSPIDASTTNFCALIANDLNPNVALKEIDPNYKQYNEKFVNSSLTFTSHANYTTYVIRLPFYGFKITASATKIFVCSTVPTGTVGEVLDVIATVTTSGASGTEYTLNYNKGSIIVFVVYTQNINPDNINWRVPSNKPFVIKRLALTSVQSEFSRYAKKDTSVNTGDANDTLGIVKYAGKVLSTTSGNVSDNSSYDTYSFFVPVESLTINCTNGFRCTKSYHKPGDLESNSNLISVVYSSADNRVDTFTASYGEWVSISINKNSYPNGLDLKTNLSHPFTLPSLKLSVSQSPSFYRYIQRTYSSGTQRYLYVYFKSGDNKVVEWTLMNTPSPNTSDYQSDTWQIGGVKGYDFAGGELSNAVQLALNGEFESAIKEHDASDYCGGINHGDEVTDTFKLFIDGRQITNLAALDEDYHVFNRIDAFEIATVNRCDTTKTNNPEPIITHQKIWNFENGKVNVHQTWKFLENLDIDVMMVCMFKAVRDAYPYGIRQGAVEIEDMETSSFAKKYTTGNDAYYEYYGANATAKIHAKTDNDGSVRQSELWINNAEDSNKLYFGYWGQNYYNHPISVPADTIVTEETEYDVAYN